LRRKSYLTGEIESHLKMAIADRMARGKSPADARTSAMREIGNVPLISDVTMDQWRGPSVDLLMQDIRYAMRRLRNSPGFTLTAIITLALGIGANTAIFTLVNGILLRSLPVNDPSRLYRIGDKDDCCYYDNYQNDNGDFDLFSYDLYLRFKEATPEFDQLAAVEAGGNGYSLRSGPAPAKAMRSEYVSGNYFNTLGVSAFSGHLLNESDDNSEAAPTLVLSHAAWQADFAADPAIVGSTVYVQMKPFVVAGIAPPNFFGDRVISNPPDFWMPLSSEPVLEGANSSLKQYDTLCCIGVLALILRGALGQVLVGLAIGVPAALLAGHLMVSLLYGLSPYDPLSLVAATGVLSLCAAVAGFLPARHAASIDPTRVLRTD
jgi:hypothetical protein